MTVHVIPRTLEPEVMDTSVEAGDYDAMDFEAVNRAFCDDFLAARARVSRKITRVLDVGCGTARIPVVVCGLAGDLAVTGIDLAVHMLSLGQAHVAAAGLATRVTLERRDAKHSGFPDGAFDAAVSNTVLHHIPEPKEMLREMWRVLPRGGLLFVRDLVRPDDRATLDALVVQYASVPAGLDPAAQARHERQRDLFAASLHAALTLDEVRTLADDLGITTRDLTMTSDRHWTLSAVKGG